MHAYAQDPNIDITHMINCTRHSFFNCFGKDILIVQRQWRYLRLGDINAGAYVSMHILGGSGGMLPRKIRCSEIVSEAIFVLKFIFGLDAARA